MIDYKGKVLQVNQSTKLSIIVPSFSVSWVSSKEKGKCFITELQF